MKYDFKNVDKKWQKKWADLNVFKAEEDYSKKKFYALVEFPYPSGNGLHVGHPRPYIAMDIVARKKRMEGYNVLYPMGWDAFGLPAENYAIKNKIHPAAATKNNADRYRDQLKMIGISYDWDREINTSDPNFYKWTQWIFLRLFEKGLAYKKEMTVNFCPSCKVVLANEEAQGGVCERCGSDVDHRVKSQWVLKITEYADRLTDDLESVDYIDRVKTQQCNWIGRSYGADVDFTTTVGDKLRIYTTRPDTLFGATYMVMAPEHPVIEKWAQSITNMDELVAYKDNAAKKSEFERTELQKDKTGCEIKGVRAINPVNGKDIPIFISDYVLVTYGTGAIMAVPGHDQRDYEFAKAFGLPIIEVVAGGDISESAFTDIENGTMCNSGFLDGMTVKDAKKAIIEYLTEKDLGYTKTNFKLRDWVFSRQRYWGEPIPLVFCEKCGWVPIDEKELPLKLPDVKSYEPTESGESPLALITDWVNTVCPKCGDHAKRETDTMPGWAGSSWYFLRYLDPHNDKELASREAIDYWMPVNWYNGGMEHTTLHLLYSRFWHKFLYDIGVVNTPEPYSKRTSHGMILGADGQKMSKSRGNVINPDETIKQYGTDTLRLYEMFIGDFEKAAPWSTSSIKGCARFLERVYGLLDILTPIGGDAYREEMETAFNKTIKKVEHDIEVLKFNTAIAAMMELLNKIYDTGRINRAELKTYLLLLNPFASHITEEMWQMVGFGAKNEAEICKKNMVCGQKWPTYDESKTVENTIELPVQINGKLRVVIKASVGAEAAEVEKLACGEASVAAALEGKTVVKVICVKDKMVNFVIKA